MAADEESPTSRPDRQHPGGEEEDAWRPDWDPQRPAIGAVPPFEAAAPVTRRRRSPAGILSGVLVLALVIAAVVVLLATGDGAPGDDPSSAPSSTAVPSSAASRDGRPDPAALAAARRVFDRVNAEAGADPARQRSVLEQVVAPAHRADQLGCAAAATTVRLLPAWSDVRIAPDGGLIVPSLVRVFTGTRITGTDVAIIDVTITAGQAGLPALCVS